MAHERVLDELVAEYYSIPREVRYNSGLRFAQYYNLRENFDAEMLKKWLISDYQADYSMKNIV